MDSDRSFSCSYRHSKTNFFPSFQRIRQHNIALLEKGAPHPPGGCAFLSPEGACRVYGDRPYVCRTQGLPLRWIDGDEEHRDICELNLAGVPLVSLPADHCWPIGPVESKLQELQAAMSAGDTPRVRLRDLFEGNSD